jgi:hypothetical protein
MNALLTLELLDVLDMLELLELLLEALCARAANGISTSKKADRGRWRGLIVI